MDTDGSLPLIIILTALIGALFTAAETAVTEFPNTKIKSFENERGVKHILWRLAAKPLRLMTEFTLFRYITVIILTAAFFILGDQIYVTVELSKGGGDAIGGFGLIPIAVLMFFAAMLTQLLIIEALPRRLTRQVNSESFAIFASPLLYLLRIILSPIILAFYVLSLLFSKLFGLPGQSAPETVTEEGIMMMVDAGNETGTIEESQAEMISNIFEFSDTPVSDVMTHRTDVTAVSSKSNCVEIIEKAVSSGFSRIPVYSENIDHIIGILCVKDLLTLIGNENPPADVFANRFIRDTIYLPETATCKNAFKQMTDQKTQMAVIMDEYGGTSGIVTMEDILETIVGNIQDEYDHEAEEITRISDTVYSIDGLASPDVILPKLGLIPDEDSEYETMSAFLIGLSGKLPEIGQDIQATEKNVKFTAMSQKDMRITRIKAEKITEEQTLE
jgi:putative hemolysin